MADIGSAVAAAGRAPAALLDRAHIFLVLLVEQVDLALIRVYMTVAAVAGRINTVKEVNAALHSLQNIGRRSDSHEIGRLVHRKIRHGLIQHMVHLLMCLADRKSADRIAVQIHLGNPLCMVDPDVRVDGSLVDAEQHLVTVHGILQTVEALHLILAALQPARRPCHGILHIFPLGKRRRTFIERHGDRGAEIGLDLHALLRSHENLCPVNMRVEIDALLLDLAEPSQGEHLKSAGIRKNRTIP